MKPRIFKVFNKSLHVTHRGHYLNIVVVYVS